MTTILEIHMWFQTKILWGFFNSSQPFPCRLMSGIGRQSCEGKLDKIKLRLTDNYNETHKMWDLTVDVKSMFPLVGDSRVSITLQRQGLREREMRQDVALSLETSFSKGSESRV